MDGRVDGWLSAVKLMLLILGGVLRCSFALQLCMNYSGLNVPSDIGNSKSVHEMTASDAKHSFFALTGTLPIVDRQRPPLQSASEA